MRGNIALPRFWRQALDALKELDLTRIQLSTDGALSQPIWDNRRFPPPPIAKLFRDRWESLQVTVIHNMFSDLEGKVRFDKETNASYIGMELDHHYFQQQKVNNERFLDSWDVIGDHLHEQIECFVLQAHNPQIREEARVWRAGQCSHHHRWGLHYMHR
jgi:hypothetical protein